MNQKGNALAERMRQVNDEVLRVAEGCSAEQWKTGVVDGDGRTVGVVFHHIALSYPFALDWADKIAKGKALPDFGREELQAYNARHAEERVETSQDEILAYLRKVTGFAARRLPAFTDEELSRVAPIPLAGNREFSGEWVIDAFSIRHAENHLAAIKKTLKVS